MLTLKHLAALRREVPPGTTGTERRVFSSFDRRGNRTVIFIEAGTERRRKRGKRNKW